MEQMSRIAKDLQTGIIENKNGSDRTGFFQDSTDLYGTLRKSIIKNLELIIKGEETETR